MSKKSKLIISVLGKKTLSVFSVLAVVLLAFPGNSSALAGQGFTLFGDTADNKITPNCYLRKEYNYFMNQWTTNETCNPRVDQVAPKPLRLANNNANITGNVYLGATTANTYYSAPSYNTAPVVYNSVPNYSYTGFYTGNNNGYSNNNWNGYGNSANYLLSSFGGGYGGYNLGSIGSYGYYNNYYPNSVFAYTPTSYSTLSSWGSDSSDNGWYKTGRYFPEYDERNYDSGDSDYYKTGRNIYNSSEVSAAHDDYGTYNSYSRSDYDSSSDNTYYTGRNIFNSDEVADAYVDNGTYSDYYRSDYSDDE